MNEHKNIDIVSALLAGIAGGEYRSIEYKVTVGREGDIREECTLYVHGHNRSTADTWVEAFGMMMEQLNNGEKDNG